MTTPTPNDRGARFAELGVPAPLIAALAERGVDEPFPIQTATLPDALRGHDVLGRGKTGSGKTIAFAVPVVARLATSRRRPQPGKPRETHTGHGPKSSRHAKGAERRQPAIQRPIRDAVQTKRPGNA